MKKFYIFFFGGFILLSTLLYFSIWWFLSGAALVALCTVFHFYNAKLKTVDASVNELESQVLELQSQLDTSLLKEEKAKKDAKKMRLQKQELLTLVSHEIRTPMNGVLGMTLLLEDTNLTKQQKEFTSSIKSSGKGLLAIVNEILVKDILDYSKFDRKDKKLETIEFDLRDTIEETLNMFAVKAGKTGIDLLYDIDDTVPIQLTGDNKRLREILMNLLENAVKFTTKGEILISVHSLRPAGQELVLNFTVSDSGTGISDVEIRKLFYEVAGNEFKNENEKSGSGLIICRKHVGLMGGEIEASSKPGIGSTFSFSIPFAYSQKSLRSHFQPDNMAILEGKNVLVADDNITSRNLLIKQLKTWKMLPVSAESGMQALEILTQYSCFDLILTDLAMPQLDGPQLARSVKDKYPQIPVVLLNPGGNETGSPELFSAIIMKPVRKYILRDTLLDLFSKSIVEKQKPGLIKSTQNFSESFPLQILIAEDNLVNQKIAIKILTNLGYQPRIANNGSEALEMARAVQYDIILMDVQMPLMDGLEATRTIRSELELQPVIIAMTANVLQGDRDSCMQAGMDDYISKPFEMKELLKQLEKWALTIKKND